MHMFVCIYVSVMKHNNISFKFLFVEKKTEKNDYNKDT